MRPSVWKHKSQEDEQEPDETTQTWVKMVPSLIATRESRQRICNQWHQVPAANPMFSVWVKVPSYTSTYSCDDVNLGYWQNWSIQNVFRNIAILWKRKVNGTLLKGEDAWRNILSTLHIVTVFWNCLWLVHVPLIDHSYYLPLHPWHPLAPPYWPPHCPPQLEAF